jgi:DMSO/TMAO reductase YedYZ molybdopterin-dependent catalytic subunit
MTALLPLVAATGLTLGGRAQVTSSAQFHVSDPLPPGQRNISSFPRFGLTRFARRFPKQTSRPELAVIGQVEHELHLPDALSGLPRVEQISDVHCVTTWSRRSLRWGGVRFVDFYEKVVVPSASPRPDATLIALRGQDGARTGMLLSDLLAPDVLLADTLDGEPLTIEHGAPLRLIAPQHYAYKSVKHLARIEFKKADAEYSVSAFRFMDHPRARVALEERGRGAPGWLLRYLYRPLVSGTVARFATAMAEYENATRRG